MKLFNSNKLFSGSMMRFRSQTVDLIFIAIVYWVMVRLGLLFVVQPEGISSIWPASGLQLAILLLNPKSQWGKLLAVIFIVNLAGNLSRSYSFQISLGFTLATTSEALLGAWVLTYFFRSKITFGRTVEIFALFGVAILSNGITALLAAAVSALAFGAPFLKTWQIWWAADGLGIILVTSLIVTWATNQTMFQSMSLRRLVEASLLVLALVIFAWLLFGPFTVAENPILRNYMLFPILIWLAFNYGPRGMASALTLFTIIAISNTLHGYGIFGFADQTAIEHLESVQIFLSVVASSGLLLSAMVTERKQSEEKLRESELRFRTIIDTSPDSITMTNLQGNILLANRESAIMYGYDDTQSLVDLNILKLVAPEDHARMIELSGLPPELNNINEFKLLRRDGSGFSGELRASVVVDAVGKPQAVIGIMRDITERKQAEENLRSAEVKYRTLIEKIPPIIYITRLQQHVGVNYISPRISSLGYAQDEWIADPDLWFNRIHPEDQDRVK